MADEKVFDEDGFELNEVGEQVLDDDGNPVPKAEEPPTGEPPVTEPPVGETPEELKARLAEIERERDGIKTDLFAERDRRREAEIERREAEIEARSKGVTSPTAGMTQEEREEWYNSPPTRREIMAELDAVEDATDRRITAAQQATSEREAKRSHKDFDEVAKLADELLASNPGLKASLDYSGDYAETKYALGKTHPTFIAKIQEATRRETIENIQKAGGRVVRTAGKTGGAGAPNAEDITAEDFSKMSSAQQAALPEAVKERVLGAID